MLKNLNHITFAVKDIEPSFYFYHEILGMTPKAKWEKGAYFTVGNLWFCLNVDNSSPAKDLTHTAFSVDQEAFTEMKKRLQEYKVKEWKENSSEGDSFYFCDPDGHKLEIHVGDINSRLSSMRSERFEGLEFFNPGYLV